MSNTPYRYKVHGQNRVRQWLDSQGIQNYTIHEDESVSVKGDVEFLGHYMDSIAVDFRSVSGSFNCSNKNLRTLAGSPQKVGKGFFCYENELTSLEFCPKKVGTYFNCSKNKLQSLEHAPRKVSVFICSDNQLISLVGAPAETTATFDCSRNQLTNLIGCPQKIGQDLHCSHNQLTSLEGAPLYIPRTLYANNNCLTSLEYCPEIVGEYFNVLGNQLTTLKGNLQKVYGLLVMDNPALVSLADFHATVERHIRLSLQEPLAQTPEFAHDIVYSEHLDLECDKGEYNILPATIQAAQQRLRIEAEKELLAQGVVKTSAQKVKALKI